MTQGERIKEIRKSLNLTLEKFGEKIGMKKNSVSQLENGKNSVTEQVIISICREYNVDYMWLKSGEGEMFKNNDDDALAAIDRIMTGENEFHKKLLKWVATSFNDEELQLLEKKIDEFIEEFSGEQKEG